jgi:hypothetical protein
MGEYFFFKIEMAAIQHENRFQLEKPVRLDNLSLSYNVTALNPDLVAHLLERYPEGYDPENIFETIILDSMTTVDGLSRNDYKHKYPVCGFSRTECCFGSRYSCRIVEKVARNYQPGSIYLWETVDFSPLAQDLPGKGAGKITLGNIFSRGATPETDPDGKGSDRIMRAIDVISFLPNTTHIGRDGYGIPELDKPVMSLIYREVYELSTSS